MTVDAWITVAVITAMVLVMAFNLAGPDLVLVGGLAVLLAAGVIAPNEAFLGLANSAVITVAVLYVVAAGVKETGALDWLARALGAPIERRIAEELAALAGPPRPSSCPRRPGERGGSGDDATINEPSRRGAYPEAPAPHIAACRDEDWSFVEAPHRFAWVEGQRVLVRPLDKPILRRFPGGRRAPAAASGARAGSPSDRRRAPGCSRPPCGSRRP